MQEHLVSHRIEDGNVKRKQINRYKEVNTESSTLIK